MRIAALGMATVLMGCGVNAGVEHSLVYNVTEAVAAGTCVPVEGPYAIPSGASLDYTVVDVDGTDHMDIGMIDDARGCAFNSGYGVYLDAASLRAGADNVPAGNYDFVVGCNNFFNDCVFSLTWTATY
jgi:hypothetical protein